MTVQKKQKKSLSLFQLILLALCLRFFVAEPFSIPSPSMYPTLQVGDYLYVSKFNYGFSRYTFHMFGLLSKVAPNSLKNLKGRLFSHAPKQGDVAVFLGVHDEVRYVKRVIGMPGDKVEFKKGVIYLNDKPCSLERIKDFTDHTVLGHTMRKPQYIETLPNGRKHLILRDDAEGQRPEDNTGPYHVPKGHFFMVGDNRNSSGDSRFMGKIGYVPLENFLGPAQFIFFSIDSSIWDIWRILDWPQIIRTSRIFSWIR